MALPWTELTHLPAKWLRLALATDVPSDRARLRAAVADFYHGALFLGRPPPVVECDSPAQMQALINDLGSAAAHGCAVLRDVLHECRVRSGRALATLSSLHPLHQADQLAPRYDQADRAFTDGWHLFRRHFRLDPATADPAPLNPREWVDPEHRLERFVPTQFNYLSWAGMEALVLRDEFAATGLHGALVRVMEQVAALVPAVGVALVCRRPASIRLDHQQRLHSARKPALLWPDGLEQHFLLGAHFSRDVFRAITAPEADPAALSSVALSWPRRAALLEWFARRALQHGAFTEVQRDRCGQLLEVSIAGERLRFVRVVDSRTESNDTLRESDLLVPLDCASAQDAVAWTLRVRRSLGEINAPEVAT
jgi:hypothetical protein